ncbi:hypothetical protein RFI_29341 [Reticulomyxa filosa]|uniref:Uncharacterized protein n=1 Tax=Reticulomyxa filosa TaxID=46433 RepID=X6M2E2_RETFI|nr:hypothetical protein RFI_29341 [Reticulomyxa filosa]|eukprot:ETO08049.1 hypothetical protein RFI_29341 [Reticulomyxa filosa]
MAESNVKGNESIKEQNLKGNVGEESTVLEVENAEIDLIFVDGKVECTGQYLILSQEELKSTNEWENKSEKHEVEQGCLSRKLVNTDRKFKKTVKMAMAQNTLMEIDTIVGQMDAVVKHEAGNHPTAMEKNQKVKEQEAKLIEREKKERILFGPKRILEI